MQYKSDFSLQMAASEINQKRFESAFNILRPIIEKNPNNPDALVLMGRCKLLQLTANPFLYKSTSDEILNASFQYFIGATLSIDADNIRTSILIETLTIIVSAMHSIESSAEMLETVINNNNEQSQKSWSAAAVFSANGYQKNFPGAENISRSAWQEYKEYEKAAAGYKDNLSIFNSLLSQIKQRYDILIDHCADYLSLDELCHFRFELLSKDEKKEAKKWEKILEKEAEKRREWLVFERHLPNEYYDLYTHAKELVTQLKYYPKKVIRKRTKYKEVIACARQAQQLYNKTAKQVPGLKFDHANKELDEYIEFAQKKLFQPYMIIIRGVVTLLSTFLLYLLFYRFLWKFLLGH